jgi:hypothetical protein
VGGAILAEGLFDWEGTVGHALSFFIKPWYFAFQQREIMKNISQGISKIFQHMVCIYLLHVPTCCWVRGAILAEGLCDWEGTVGHALSFFLLNPGILTYNKGKLLKTSVRVPQKYFNIWFVFICYMFQLSPDELLYTNNCLAKTAYYIFSCLFS